MKNVRRFGAAALAVSFAFCLAPPPVWGADPKTEGELHGHEAALAVPTEDPVLKEQIQTVAEALNDLHRSIAQKRRVIQASADESAKSALYAELDGLRKEHDMLERLLHDLVEEAQATEWTRIDEALRRIKPYERRQEHSDEKEEALRERQQ